MIKEPRWKDKKIDQAENIKELKSKWKNDSKECDPRWKDKIFWTKMKK